MIQIKLVKIYKKKFNFKHLMNVFQILNIRNPIHLINFNYNFNKNKIKIDLILF